MTLLHSLNPLLTPLYYSTIPNILLYHLYTLQHSISSSMYPTLLFYLPQHTTLATLSCTPLHPLLTHFTTLPPQYTTLSSIHSPTFHFILYLPHFTTLPSPISYSIISTLSYTPLHPLLTSLHYSTIPNILLYHLYTLLHSTSTSSLIPHSSTVPSATIIILLLYHFYTADHYLCALPLTLCFCSDLLILS